MDTYEELIKSELTMLMLELLEEWEKGSKQTNASIAIGEAEQEGVNFQFRIMVETNEKIFLKEEEIVFGSTSSVSLN
jgi:hypothetical protein